MNIERINRAAQELRELKKDIDAGISCHFDIGEWFDHDDDCGTTACLAGWICLSKGFREAGIASDDDPTRIDGTSLVGDDAVLYYFGIIDDTGEVTHPAYKVLRVYAWAMFGLRWYGFLYDSFMHEKVTFTQALDRFDLFRLLALEAREACHEYD